MFILRCSPPKVSGGVSGRLVYINFNAKQFQIENEIAFNIYKKDNLLSMR